jgi:Fe-S-cluster containining protein
MKLDVLPWYSEGLTFTCSQCGNCCTGPHGYIYASDEEIRRLAEFLKLTCDEVVEKYCRKVGGKLSFREKRGTGGWDCIFLEEIESTRRPEGADREIACTKRVCSIYPVRPLQCRTWPFWDGNLASRENWDTAAERCPGMNHGKRRFTLEQIEALKDAKDWPAAPPSSDATD